MYQDFSIWAYILITLGLTHITIAAVTIYLHRHQTHRALELHPAVGHFFRFWLWLTTGTITRQWVAVHRKHHARVDTEEDPHSPRFFGINKVLFDGIALYRKECENQETIHRYGHETPDDWIERLVYSRYSNTGIALMLLVNVLLFGFIGISIWAIQMAWIPFLSGGVINGIGHWRGYRNFETADASTNVIPLGFLIGGEELHNNHHAFASSAKLSCRWYEFDLGWFYICILKSLGLARVKKTVPRPVIDYARQRLDMDTVKAIVSSRFHVMAYFSRDVMNRVYKEEKRKASIKKRRLLRRGRRLLSKHEILLDNGAKDRLDEILSQSESLQVVYEYKQRLLQLWQQRSASHESLLASLQDWCSQAEATHIQALQEFAQKLRAYSLQPV